MAPAGPVTGAGGGGLYGNKVVENEPAHLTFLAGKPRLARGGARRESRPVRRTRTAARDHPTSTSEESDPDGQNPVFASGLGQMTLGLHSPATNGGLLMARVRYFDPGADGPACPRTWRRWWSGWSRTHGGAVGQHQRLGGPAPDRPGRRYREHCFTDVRWKGAAPRSRAAT